MFDRFSNHPTPSQSPGPRSYSPATRKPTHLAPQRPPFGPRSSSLSLVSRTNSSTESLPKVGRTTNGSALRQELSPPPDVEDPLRVLERVVGASIDHSDSIDHDTPIPKPTELSEDIDFKGSSLEAFITESPKTRGGARPRAGTIRTVEEFEKEKDDFEDLHKSIQACDHVLKSVETSLAGFQKDLGLVSQEIETLQSRSTALNTKLENRKVVEKLLGPAVEEISISPLVVKTISEGQINENWVRALAELQKRRKAVENKLNAKDGTAPAKAVADVKPLLDNLTTRAIERIRDYIISQIKAIRSPNINAQIIQQQNLARYKDLWTFLASAHPELAEVIGKAYVNTIRWYYLNHFTRYRQALDKLSVVHVDKTETLASDPSAPKNKPPSAPSTYDVHNIGRRGDILTSTNPYAISSYLAEEDKTTHFIETPFRSFNLALIDNICAEYSFLTSFFTTDTFPRMSRRCAAIFAPTFALGQTLTTDLISSSADCLGILLCVRITQGLAFTLQRRKVPVADSYINGLNMALWPRFQVAMDLHCESIKALSGTISARSAASKLSFTGSAADASKLSTAPHFLTQRFGQFLYGILAVSRDAGDDEPVANSLARLRGEYEAFLAKASKTAGADTRKRERFLANNYSLVLAIIGDAEGRLAGEMKAHFEEMGAQAGK
ncbi:MAG: hypothetical protein MMC23_009713 [Stictis urceolatum]|nr:hypothetical protein [Stictis urceolata]